MADLEKDQARIDAALSKLEQKIQTLGEDTTNEALVGQVARLEEEFARLREAGQGALKDLDLALSHLDDVEE